MAQNSISYTVVLVRHGESTANVLKTHSGWNDVALTEKGVKQAKEAGIVLKNAGYKFDFAHTSMLRRAQRTLELILEELGQTNIPVMKTWRLNERHFGEFTGMTYAEVTEKFEFDKSNPLNTPPPMQEDHPYYNSIVKDPRYKDSPTATEFPFGESLEDAVGRFLPHWSEVIVPQILVGKKVLIVSHGGLLKGLAMHLDNLSREEVLMFRSIPNATPFIYRFDEHLKPVESLKFLSTDENHKS